MNDDQPLHFHLPPFVFNFAPTPVPGGGAEVIPPTNLEWFASNGFDYSPDHHFLADSHQQAPAAEQYESSSPPFNFADSDVSFPPPTPAAQPDLNLLSSLAIPSPYGLPVYSVTGLDILSILSRVYHRPNPTVHFGPVDLSTSFVVSDARRYDAPIVYCSPNFTNLTGYAEHEIIGRNCRFLQAPGGQLAKGEERKYVSGNASNILRKALITGKDCQTTIINYKKNGSAFINLVTIITLYSDDKEPLYHVGFQVDLTEQPNGILERLQNGTYVANFEPRPDPAAQNNPQPGNSRDRKVNAIPPLVMSKDLKRLLEDSSFLRSFSLSSTNGEESVSDGSNSLLHLFLLDASPDFIHVVSLKGKFLYVAPGVRRVLGYESEEMIDTSLADYAHPEDVVPLMRELKESSATGVNASSNEAPVALPVMPRSVDLLFRAKTKMGRYVWVECRGRLYVEPGKGRKAIILSGRAREMMSLKWEDVNLAGGLAKSVRHGTGKESKEVAQEVWGTLGGTGRETATFMSVGQGMPAVLGWAPDELLGGALMDVIVDESVQATVGDFIQSMRDYQQRRLVPAHRRAQLDSARSNKIRCWLRKRDGSFADVWLILYRADLDGDEEPTQDGRMGISISPASLVYQVRLAGAETISCGPDTLPPVSPHSVAGVENNNSGLSVPTTTNSQDLFEELSIARGSSWQYELQQLRFANARLEEELAALEAAAEAAETRKATASRSNTTTKASNGSTGAEQLAARSARETYEAHIPTTYPTGFHRAAPPPPPPPPPPPASAPTQELFSRGQLVVPEHAHVYGNGGGGVYESLGIHPFLYHPKPQYSPQAIMSLADQQSQKDRKVMTRHPPPPPPQVQQQQQHWPNTWGTMPSPSSPPPPPPPPVYAQHHPQVGQMSRRAGSGSGREMDSFYGGSVDPQRNSTGLKRSWSSIDS